jgi:hypothetical protein
LLQLFSARRLINNQDPSIAIPKTPTIFFLLSSYFPINTPTNLPKASTLIRSYASNQTACPNADFSEVDANAIPLNPTWHSLPMLAKYKVRYNSLSYVVKTKRTTTSAFTHCWKIQPKAQELKVFTLYSEKTEILTFTLQFVHEQFLFIDFESPHKLFMLPKEVS